MDKKTSVIFKLISFCYILMPLGLLFLLSIYDKSDPITAIRKVGFNNIHQIQWWYFFISGPIVGLGLLFVKRWGWYAFLFQGSSAIVINIIYLISGMTKLESIVTILILTGILGLFAFLLRREIRAPFFNPATRWWDLESKAKIEMDSLVTFTDQSIDGQIHDISKIGCFLRMEPVYHIGEEVSIKIDIQHKLRGNLHGKIVWIARDHKKLPDGIGIKFYRKNEEEVKFLDNIISKLKTLKKEK